MKNNGLQTTLLLLKSKPDAVQMKAIKEFSEISRKDGCSLCVLQNDTLGPVLCLTINRETARNSRGAGRRKKPLKRQFRLISVGDVKIMLQSKTADEVAADLGVSRSTLFRRLKDKEDRQYF